MDWAEELKMSIRKTTARKGRRAKSRDLLKDEPQTSSSVTSNSATAGQVSASTTNPEVSIDINLDLQSSNVTSTSNNVSTPLTAGGGAGDISNLLTGSSSDTKRPPILRRISGGWADSGGGSKLKSKKGSFDDDRFGLKSSANTSSIDNIPIIPDLDDIKDDILMNDTAETQSFSVNNVVTLTLKELNSDLLAQNAFSTIEDVDLSILTKCLQPQEHLDEADEVWEWQQLFTDVIAEINSDKPLDDKMKQLELKPDEIHPPSSQD